MAKQNNGNPDIFTGDDKVKFRQMQEAIERPDVFSEIFCNAAQKQTNIAKMLSGLFIEQLEHNTKVKEAVQAVFKESEKKEILAFWKKAGGLVWTAFVSIGSICLVLFSEWLKKLLFP